MSNVPHPASRIPHSAFRIPHPASRIDLPHFASRMAFVLHSITAFK
jgi:hypothetical protein